MISLDKKGDNKSSFLRDREKGLKSYIMFLVILMFLIVIGAPMFNVPGIVNLVGILFCGVASFIIYLTYLKFCFGSLFENKEDKTKN
jgi:hypothetical protein